MSIVLIVAIVCLIMGLITAIAKVPTLLSSTDWFLLAIAVVVIFRGMA